MRINSHVLNDEVTVRINSHLRGMKKLKLELGRIGKENRPRLEPRILLEDPEKSYHAV